MNVLAGAVALMLAQGGAALDVASEELIAERNEVAIERIEANDRLDRDDPARLINLGIAHAREGRVQEARQMFRKVAGSDAAMRLELTGGEWVDSRDLARRALRMLDRGEFANHSRMTMR
ncbi:hypothetical protein [Pelagerythrobacter aerophilus]|nr:hypothetical protein [Pelagerythrobacter aerophilus]